MRYIDLVNLVIQESGNELNELTDANFATAEAGQRVYPRIKRYVAQAWKVLQMQRNQWEFGTAKVDQVIYPRVRFSGGSGAATPSPGDIFVGDESGFTFTVRQVLLTDGLFTTDDAEGNMEFEVFESGPTLVNGETFVDQSDPLVFFTYEEPGNYDFDIPSTTVAEIDYGSMISTTTSSYGPQPIIRIPWENWFFSGTTYVSGSRNSPQYVAEDYAGRVVFYPQIQSPFRLSFVYARKPQILTAFDDEPEILPEAYHEWISWEALMRLATYDKNAQLFAHAQKQANFFRGRAESNLMPKMSWRENSYNNNWTPSR